MQRYLSAVAEGSTWQEIVAKLITRLGDIPDDANLGFVYATDSLAPDFGHMIEALRTRTGITHWVGTIGIGICADGNEYYDAPAASALVAAFPQQSFRVFPSLHHDLSDLTRLQHEWNSEYLPRFGVVHGDPRTALTPQLLPALSQRLPDLYLVGGLSSSQGDYAQYADHECEGSLSGVLFTEQISVATTLTQGCSPISDKHVVSDCEQNVVRSLDGRPALDVFKEDIGEVLSRDLQRVGGYIFVGLPIPGSDTGDYVVRNLVAIDPDKRELIIGDAVYPGQQLQFCRRDGSSAWEDLQRAINALKARVSSPIKGALYYSCLGRGRYLFGENSEELRFIQEQLGNVPLAGFFANGEIAKDQLYGYTGVLTVFL